jgi:hypothetical protein
MFIIKFQINKNYLLILLSIFFLFILSGCQFNGSSFLFPQNQSSVNEHNLANGTIPLTNIENSSLVSRLLDGVTITLEQNKKLPICIVFDNFPGAPRPTLADASIIYEMPVEGGITRFLAIFDQANLPDLAGPIRSARPYSAEVASEYKCIYIHAGGSDDALFKLKQGFYGVSNLDEISWQGRYFWRDQSQAAPHNLYISKEGIDTYMAENKINNTADFSAWYYGQDLKFSNQEAKNVEINFSPLIDNHWQYDENLKQFRYSPNSKAYRDKNNKEILVDNLIVQYAPIKILDEIGRREITLTGQGKALIFQQGKAIVGQWRKEAGRTKFYNGNGEEIFFVPGKTWVSVVAPTNQVSY